MEKTVKQELNNLIARHKSAMFDFDNGFVYFVPKHWKYLAPQLKNAFRIKIAKSGKPKCFLMHSRYMYRTEKI